MGSAESCCGRNEKTKSSSVDRSRGDVKKRNEDRPIENVDENAEKKNLSQKKKHSVHEGTGPPPGITSTDDITMQESDAEPKQMKPPGLHKIYTGKHLNGGNKHLKAQSTNDSTWVDDGERPLKPPGYSS
eukprot:g3104.t1